MIERKTSATHEIIREDEDLFIYRWGHGPATGDDVAALVEVEQKGWQEKRIYSLTTLDDGLSITPGALTRASKIYQHSPPRTSAFVMRRHYLRTAMEFLVRTTRLLGLKVEAGFFQDEQEARDWIMDRRRGRLG